MAEADDLARLIEDEITTALETEDPTAREEILAAAAASAFMLAYEDAGGPEFTANTFVASFVRSMMSAIGNTFPDPTDLDAQAQRISQIWATAAINSSVHALAPPGAEMTWVTMQDDKVRDLHQPLHGTTARVGQTFMVGGVPTRYPGEPVGPPENWINCRCRLSVSTVPAVGRDLPPAIAAASDPPRGVVVVARPATPDSLAVPGGLPPDELHVTLGYFGLATQLDNGLRPALENYVRGSRIASPESRVSGWARMGDDVPPATALLVENPELNRLRAELEAVAPPDATHPHFTPHMTLGYGIDPPTQLPASISLDRLELWWAGDRVGPELEPQTEEVEMDDLAAAVSEEPWSNWTAADYSIEQWHRACLIHLHQGAPTSKAQCKLPVRTPSGTVNRAGVHAAAAALAGARGGVDAPPADKAKAARALRGLYRQLGDEPPESLAADGCGECDEAVVAVNTRDGPGWLTNPRETQRLRNYWTRGAGAAKIRWGTPGDLTRCRNQLIKYVGPQWVWGTCNNLHHVVFGKFNPQSRRGDAEDLTEIDTPEFRAVREAFAAAATLEDEMLPPMSLFVDPQFTGPQPMSVRAAGEFTEYLGHLAAWETCHVGMAGRCVPPPRSQANYAYFRTGEVETDQGPVAVGHITAGTGHATTDMDPAATVRHYDDTGTVVADVAVGEDAFGIWAHGIARPGVAEDQLYALRAGAPSGDWRRIGGNLELVGALIVNVPGYPIPRGDMAASGERVLSLVASGIVVDVDPSLNASLIAQAVIAVLDGREKRRARLEILRHFEQGERRDRAQRVLASLEG